MVSYEVGLNMSEHEYKLVARPPEMWWKPQYELFIDGNSVGTANESVSVTENDEDIFKDTPIDSLVVK